MDLELPLPVAALFHVRHNDGLEGVALVEKGVIPASGAGTFFPNASPDTTIEQAREWESEDWDLEDRNAPMAFNAGYYTFIEALDFDPLPVGHRRQ